MLRLMEPVTPIIGHRGLTNRWRHYELWQSPVQNFIAVGDAACAFNPVFAQGMTCAARSASTLGRVLRECGPDGPQMAAKFFAAQARFQRDPWVQTVSTDVALPGTAGDRSLGLRFFNWYRDGVNLAARNPAVLTTAVEVLNLLAPNRAIFAPSIVAQVAMAKAAVTLARLAGRSLIPPITPSPPLRTQPVQG